MKINTMLIACLVIVSSQASAAEFGQPYFNVEYSHMTIEAEGVKANPNALFLRVGKQLQQNFSIEGFFGLGLSNDELFSEQGFDPFLGNYSLTMNIGVSTIVGVQAKVFADLSPTSEIFAAIGLNSVDLEFELETCIDGFCDNITVSDDDTDLTYQFGVNIQNFTLSYNVYYDDSYDGLSLEASSINLGYHAAF